MSEQRYTAEQADRYLEEKTRREAARRAKEQLDRVGARLLGTALSNVKPEKSSKSEYGATGR